MNWERAGGEEHALGIRIRKALGYGITVAPDEIENTLNLDTIDNRGSLSSDDYLEYLKKRYPENLRRESDFIASDLHSLLREELQGAKPSGYDVISVADTGEEDEGNGEIHLVITPYLMLKEWKHFDDAIDYYEADYAHNHGTEGSPMQSSMKFFDHGLFPYDGAYINRKTGKLVKSGIYHDARHFAKNALSMGFTPEDTLSYFAALSTELGVESEEDMEENIVPRTPVPAIDYAEFSGIFKSPETVGHLRPALLTYWA